MVFVSPVGPYFKGGVRPLHLKINKEYHRAAPKGIGNAKAIGNYSASLYPLTEAKSEGYDEVLYLDAKEDKFLEEVGSANLFVIKENKLMTPKLRGSILAGITRDSVMRRFFLFFLKFPNRQDLAYFHRVEPHRKLDF